MKFSPACRPELCVSRDETRPNLTDVYLDAGAKMLLATDGRLLVQIPASVEDRERSGFVPKEALAKARKNGGVMRLIGRMAEAMGVYYPRPKPALPFPSWQTIDPKYRPGSPKSFTICLNPEVLLRACRAIGMTPGGLLKGVTITCAVTDDGKMGLDPLIIQPANVDQNGALAILMPCRY